MELLLVRAGPWQVALDARHVAAVASEGARAEGPMLSLSALLAGPEPTAPSLRRRALQVASTPLRWLATDGILGFRDLDAALLAPLPPFLWHHGTPRWVLGTLWLETQLLYLVDVLAAASGRRGGA